ncbi:MAG: metal-dependent hydrolase [Deltaproteobacteria bacterium]|nr:metal-dependent hydrolase [Deltaproteobacteria bacterium]
MPTPIAHSLVSLTLSDARPEGTHLIKWATFWVILGNFADFDFLPGILLGAPGRFHHGFTHSILFAVVLSVVAYHVYPLMFRRRVSFWVFLSVTGSHLFLDCLTLDTVAPFGLPLFWPFSQAYFRFPFSLFLNVERAMSLRILLSWHNFLAISLEIVLTLPFLVGVWFVRNGRRLRREREGLPSN